ncbi:T9SS type A sorting domain-containing protein [Aurantibacter sp.]|uniref:T9SS type A sorting domain-containing protein n=1 Tax=Aurantibacter sp. TaxID=2807103 RepID=UPI0035C876FF
MSKNITLNSNNQKGFGDLKDATKKNIELTGYARCLSDENELILQQESKSRYSNDDFENWLKPHVEKIKADRLAGKSIAPIYNIPVIIHIIHNGDAVATDENISYNQAISQIQVMNEDFQRLAGTRGGANTTGAAVDVQISFCLAQQDANGNPSNGVVRHNITPYSNTGTPAVTDDWEARNDVETMKATTQWDPTLYLNMWTIKPGGLTLANGGLDGLLGYAQFPDNSGLGGLNTSGGNANTDGVVAAFDTMGTMDLDDGSFNMNPTYNLGRTMTHEVGHWVGLRHTWGDGPASGSCGVDDYCADTPNQAQPNYSCNTNNDSCTGGGIDMVQNYMDYTNDACMDTFTQNQKDRIIAVMQNSPRRNMNASIGCNTAAPTANFTTSAPASSQEGSDCNFTDYTFNISLSDGGSQSATVSLLNSGTAIENEDFELIDNSVTFTAGATSASGNNTITLRIFEDDFVETDETITLNLSVNTAGNTIASLVEFNHTIISDDLDIAQSTYQDYQTDFQTSNSNTWSILNVDTATSTWFTTDVQPASNLYLAGVIEGFAAISTSDTNDTSTDDYLFTETFPVSSTANRLDVSHALYSLGSTEVAVFYILTENNEYIQIGNAFLAPGFTGNNDLINVEIPFNTPELIAVRGTNIRLVVRHTIIPTQGFNNDNGSLIWDTLTVTELSDTLVQTAINQSVSNDSAQINIVGSLNASDNNTGNAMLSISPNTNFNYGCTATSVSRAGTSTQSYNGSTVADNVMDKTFTITPTNINNSGNVTIDFYFTNTEINGWTSSTGNAQNALGVRRIGASTSEFSTITITNFGANALKASATFTQGMEGTYYFGRAESLSVIKNNKFQDFSIFPNPTNNVINIAFNSQNNNNNNNNNNNKVSINILDVRGRLIMKRDDLSVRSEKFQTSLNVSNLASGIYLLQVNQNNTSITKKIIIQ